MWAGSVLCVLYLISMFDDDLTGWSWVDHTVGFHVLSLRKDQERKLYSRNRTRKKLIYEGFHSQYCASQGEGIDEDKGQTYAYTEGYWWIEEAHTHSCFRENLGKCSHRRGGEGMRLSTYLVTYGLWALWGANVFKKSRYGPSLLWSNSPLRPATSYMLYENRKSGDPG